MLDILRCALLECGIDHDDAEWMSEKIRRRIEAPNNANERVYAKVLETWGKRAQITMVFEEMSELQKELCKSLRGEKNLRKKIGEEIADVEIMLGQMKVLYGIKNWVNKAKQCKIERLRMGLEKSEGGE